MPAQLLRLFSLLPALRTNQNTNTSEDSILFRVLVQAMVSIGIMATDVAAETQMSWWAVPLSIIGATWSWRQRQRPQIALKFGLAAALLIALFSFFQHLLGSLNDTRLVLAELLVQVQTIHTFDMPRRKDLGYSIVIGVILVAVAATIGQTMAFAPMLLLFLCLALPVMVLDYRSRLGMAPASLPVRGQAGGSFPVPIANLAKLLVTTLLLGLLVFALMPRLPSYQIQSMPMSGEMPATNFDGSKIANPGYQNKGKGKGGKTIDRQAGGATDDSEFDDSSYYGFNQRMDQTLRGQLKPKLVLRVRSQSPGFWRVLAFDRYTGQGWEISQNEQTKTIDRGAWSSKFHLPRLLSKAPAKKIIQSYTAVSELPNVLPALTVPTEAYFPSQKMAVDREGSLRSAAGLSPGFTYTIVSEVAERNATALGQAGFKYEPDFQLNIADYLQIPPDLAKKLRSFTDKIIADYPKAQITKDAEPLNNNYDVALYLAQYLKQNYEVPKNPSDLSPLPKDKDLVNWFLGGCPNKTCGGYPDHFATVHTMMLRSIGIPARLAVGFEPGYFNPFTGMYEVKNTDAHALTEVYFPKYGWYSFDPLPGHPLFPPSIEEDQTFGVVKQLWNWVAGLLPSPVSAWIGTIVGAVVGWLVALWLFVTNSWLGAIFGLALAIGLVFGGWLLWQQWRRWRYNRWLQQQPPMERLYLQMLVSLSRWSIAPKLPSQTPFEHWEGIPFGIVSLYAGRVEMREGIEPIVLAYVAWKYGNQHPPLDYLQSILRSLQKAMLRSFR
jgi:transglutaminase-like putative cysteine protease